jgi:hypothetical protein
VEEWRVFTAALRPVEVPRLGEPGNHTWVELLRVVGAVRRLAFDGTLPPTEAMGRIRDAFTVYDGVVGDE